MNFWSNSKALKLIFFVLYDAIWEIFMHGECDFCQKISNGSQILVSIASTEETINSGTDFLSLSLIENFF